MNDKPAAWQLWLLARFPRPVAVILIGTISTLTPLVIIAIPGSFFAYMGYLWLGKFGIVAGVVVMMIFMMIGEALRDAYKSWDEKLPTREKKQDD